MFAKKIHINQGVLRKVAEKIEMQPVFACDIKYTFLYLAYKSEGGMK